ncbi:hypothetical protein VSR34_33230 [Paraburkholderia sp. JHI2823]|uniref:hypothetical protein n=1 Tax=Paraburkholderia sp. JHI2823 TaxID=3112960 RepID=UPI0031721DF4
MGSLIEMVVFLAASAILTVVSIQQDVAKRRAEVLAAEGQNEGVIVSALASWVSDNFSNLLTQYTASGGNAVLSAPTLAQLKSSGELKQNYAAGPFWGGAYTIQMSMVPAGCTQAAGNCHVTWAFYPSMPYKRNGVSDVEGAAQIALAGNASNGQFGYSSTRNSATVYGINGAWNASNPLPGAPAGAILATNGSVDDGTSLYIRRDGSLTWTGDQNVNGVSLHNVNSIDATGTIAAPTLAASNVAVSNSIRTPGTLQVENAAGTAPAPISTGAATVNGNATITGTAQVGNIAVPRTACSGTGIAGDADGSGLMLSCQRGIWLPIGGTILRYGYYTVANGSWVPAPTCAAGGTPQIVIDGQSLYVDPTATVNYGVSGTGPWTVSITDGSGSGVGGWAVATTYCAF